MVGSKIRLDAHSMFARWLDTLFRFRHAVDGSLLGHKCMSMMYISSFFTNK